jgi:hypothetical protein|nr:MAG TPA: hypothetical protein [Caudoviricetes sp.]
MCTDEDRLVKLCDTRKAIIEWLASMGLDAQQIYDYLHLPYTNNVHQYIEDATEHYDTVVKCMHQLDEMGIDPDDATTNLYYFDWEEGVCTETVLALMLYGTPYHGQKLVRSPAEIIPVILRPLVDEAVEDGNTANLRELAEAMDYVVDELIPQEQANG